MKPLLTAAVILFLTTAFARAQALPHRKHTRPPYKGPHKGKSAKPAVPKH